MMFHSLLISATLIILSSRLLFATTEGLLKSIQSALEDVKDNIEEYDRMAQVHYTIALIIVSATEDLKEQVSLQLGDRNLELEDYLKCRMENCVKVNRPKVIESIVKGMEKLTGKHGILHRKYTEDVDYWKSLLQNLEAGETSDTEGSLGSVTQPSTHTRGASRLRPCIFSIHSWQSLSDLIDSPLDHQDVQDNPTNNPTTITPDPTTSAQVQATLASTHRPDQPNLCNHSLPTEYRRDIQRIGYLLSGTCVELGVFEGNNVIVKVLQNMSSFLMERRESFRRIASHIPL